MTQKKSRSIDRTEETRKNLINAIQYLGRSHGINNKTSCGADCTGFSFRDDDSIAHITAHCTEAFVFYTAAFFVILLTDSALTKGD